jgi:hypothetical protein
MIDPIDHESSDNKLRRIRGHESSRKSKCDVVHVHPKGLSEVAKLVPEEKRDATLEGSSSISRFYDTCSK